MPRNPRIDYEGAYHHVTNRGRNKQPIFGNDADRELFLSHLGAAAALHGVEIHAYALMDNHYHLLLRSLHGELSNAMQFLGSRYTQDINGRHGLDGALFKGRFFSKLIDNERYLLEAARYVPNNPVKAQLTTRPEDYQWSSYASAIGLTPAPEFLNARHLIDEFFNGDTQAYRAFVTGAATSKTERYEHIIDGYESSQRLSESLAKLDQAAQMQHRLSAHLDHLDPRGDLICAFVQNAFDISRYELASPLSKRGRSANLMLLTLLYRLEICTFEDLASALDTTVEAMRRTIQRFERTARRDPRLSTVLASGRHSLLRNAA